MRFGVDFGTTRTTVAYVDRGNHPVLTFEDPNGDLHNFIPSVVALDDNRLTFGFEAAALASQGAPHLRSFKRLLADPAVTPTTTVRLARRDIALVDLLTRFLSHVADMVRTCSSVATLDEAEPLQATIGVPAHAHSGQRFLTLEAFRAAGWEVLAMLNEPSAAGFEYTHRHRGTLNSKRRSVLVYDLGGGTFDASLVSAEGGAHEVIASRGNNLLGGDDFDLVLAQIAAETAGTSSAKLGDAQWEQLIEQCRNAKESLGPHSRFVTVEVEDAALSIPVADYYARVAPLIEATMDTMEPLLLPDKDQIPRLPPDVAGLYLVGGGSELPAVARTLRSLHGRRVHRSAQTAASTAIGLSIASDPEAGYTVRDTLSRGVGVFRERDSGSEVSFDPLLGPDTRLSEDGSVTFTRTYRAAHNVGWFRFVEYSHTDDHGVPRGDVIPCGEVIMPFDPELQRDDLDLRNISIRRSAKDPLIEERYTVDTSGFIHVEIVDTDTGWTVRKTLGVS